MSADLAQQLLLKTLPPCRFDVVAMSGDTRPDWIKNAFDDMG